MKNNLKNQYQEYTSPFDEAAWNDFKQLRNGQPPLASSHPKKARRWPLFIVGVTLCLGAYIVFNNLVVKKEVAYHKKGSKQTVASDILPVSYEDSAVSTPSYSREEAPELVHKKQEESAYRAISSTTSQEVKKNKIYALPAQESPTPRMSREVIGPATDGSMEENDRVNVSWKEESKISELNESKDKNYITKSQVNNRKSIGSTEQKNSEYTSLLAFSSLPMLETRPLFYRALVSADDISFPPQFREKKNTIKISGAYADFYNSTGTIGIMDYRRDLNKILSLGVTLGYGKGQGTYNREPTLYQQYIGYIHGSVYFNIINNQTHNLFLKGSAGWLSSRSTFPNQQNIRMTGYSLETGYDYTFATGLCIGIHAGSIIANEGANFIGLSGGYKF